MSMLIVAVRPGDTTTVRALLARFGAAVAPLPGERNLCRLRAVMPQPSLRPALAALREAVPALRLCAVENEAAENASSRPLHAFRALSEPSPLGETAARRLFGFKNWAE